MKGICYVTIIVAIFAMSHSTDALVIPNKTMEPCFDIKETVSVDLNWMASADTWYYIFQSRTNLVHLCEALWGGQVKNLTEDQIYLELCPYLVVNGTDSTLHGFGNRQVKYLIAPHEGRLDVVNFSVTDPDKHTTSGLCYKTSTDNSTFFVNACCFEDGRMTWEAVSPLKQLADERKEQIFDHAESLGFKRKEFTAVRYDACSNH